MEVAKAAAPAAVKAKAEVDRLLEAIKAHVPADSKVPLRKVRKALKGQRLSKDLEKRVFITSDTSGSVTFSFK
jgi:hypothetical protein